MISVSTTVPVNPADADVRLERGDVWDGLVAKANNALPFVPSMGYCEVLSQEGNVMEREIEFRGDRFLERITLEPEHTVTFLRHRGPVLGTIRNEIIEDDAGELQLRFSFDLELEGAEPGSHAERDYEETMSADYLKAAETTLNAIRRAVREGQSLLPTP